MRSRAFITTERGKKEVKIECASGWCDWPMLQHSLARAVPDSSAGYFISFDSPERIPPSIKRKAFKLLISLKENNHGTV